MYLYTNSYGDYRDILDNVSKIRQALKSSLSSETTLIEFHCYNREEVDQTKERLTENERRQVRFFWLNFDESK